MIQAAAGTRGVRIGWLPRTDMASSANRSRFSGGKTVLMAPLFYSAAPLVAGHLHHRARTSGANFAYELCAAASPRHRKRH
jgi:hypothetical protein